MATDRIRFCSTPLRTDDMPDAEFLRLLQWRNSADPRITAAADAGKRQTFARALRLALNSSKRPPRAKPETPPLLQPLWSRHAFGEAADPDHGTMFLKELQRCLGRGKSSAKSNSRISRLVARELASSRDTPASPLALLRWLTVLTTLGPKLSDGVLFTLWRKVLEASLAAELDRGHPIQHGDAVPEADDGCGVDDRQLLVAGELSWRIGLCFSDLRGAGKLRKAGRRCLRDGLESLTDGDGTPHAGALHRLPLTLAVLTRSTAAGNAAGEPLWSSHAAERFESLISRAAGLCHADGRIALSNGASFAPASLLRTASQIAGLSKREPSARRLLSLPDDSPLSGQRNRKRPAHAGLHKNSALRKRLPSFDAKAPPSTQSDWAELACLRNNWLMGADRCVIAHHQTRPQICLTAFERTLIDGDWQPDLRVDGKPVALDGEWSCVCWFSDKDADYLELQQDAEGVTVTRQVMLSRTDHWLFLADAAVAAQAETIELTTQLPLAERVECKAARWSRELRLSRQKLKATVYPLALDQQRVLHAHGSLEARAGELLLRQQATGAAVYAPLLIDWSPERRRASERRQFEWRRLTVAEDGVILGADAATGFRLRVGKHQWVFYRSLVTGETARTVLGHHTRHETVIAEFTAAGNIEPLVMVE